MPNVQTASLKSYHHQPRRPDGLEIARRLYGLPVDSPPEEAAREESAPLMRIYPCLPPMLPDYLKRRRRRRRGVDDHE